MLAAETTYPDSVIIILGDFNHTNLKKVLPRYKQHVNCSTRNNKTLDHCYTIFKDAYRATTRAPLGESDHATVVLIPTYRQKLKTIKPTTKTVRKRTADSTIALKACLDSTDWQMFKDSCHDLDAYTDTVTAYISWCEETCYESKLVTVYGNDKPWFTRDIKQKLAMKNSAFISGNREEFRRAKYAVRKAISSAKYKRKLENQFASNNNRSVWQGLRQITQYKPSALAIYNADPSFPDQLNEFYSRFDKLNTSPEQRPLPTDTSLSPPFTVNVADVRTLFKRLSTRKASGPDNISSYTFKNCADQLAPVFADIYNSSLQQCIVPTCFKTSVIIPIPKKAKASIMNDYRPVALTSVAMKVFEHIMLRYLKSSTAGLLDPHQFAYQTNRSVDDAVALGLHYVMNHLEQPSTYARILFVDFSSAFNTIIPVKLFDKLVSLNVHPAICHWTLNFLLHRPQSVKVKNSLSKPVILNTGAPQGCVLSPFLFTLFTNDCVSGKQSVRVVKFSDDTTVIGCVNNANESVYREEVQRLVGWCKNNNLVLNISKTKEMIIDFRKKKTPIHPLVIDGTEVLQADSVTFLGSTISKDLSWCNNTIGIIKKAQKRMYFLRHLKRFGLSQAILTRFYRAVIESVLSFSITVWFGRASQDEINQIESVVKYASKLIGLNMPSIRSLYLSRSLRKSKRIVQDEYHPANHLFELLPSGKRYRSIKTKTTRFNNSFYPQALRFLNGEPS